MNKVVFPIRNIDELQFKKAKIYCTDGKVYIGKGDCVSDISDNDNSELDGLLFFYDDGKTIIFTEDEIEKYELLD